MIVAESATHDDGPIASLAGKIGSCAPHRGSSDHRISNPWRIALRTVLIL
jgi:hypothetical protein